MVQRTVRRRSDLPTGRLRTLGDSNARPYLRTALAPGGRLFQTPPADAHASAGAWNPLYSVHDDIAGHAAGARFAPAACGCARGRV